MRVLQHLTRLIIVVVCRAVRVYIRLEAFNPTHDGVADGADQVLRENISSPVHRICRQGKTQARPGQASPGRSAVS